MWSLDYTRGSKTQNLGRVSKNSISMYIHHSCRYRHCADGVLSFANTYNQVADIASTTSEIITRWAQSATRNFDDIVVALVDLEWSRLNRPVFSTKEDGHQCYIPFLRSQPTGKPMLCHNRCGAHIRSKVRANSVKHICTMCKSRASTPRVELDKDTLLGKAGFLKVPLSFEHFETEWKLPQNPAKLDQLAQRR